jgi:DNA invertase Pin-like site-specific DNA recombinase
MEPDEDLRLKELRRHGRTRRRDLASIDRTMEKIAPLVRALRADGFPKTLIAEAAHITRPTLDLILRER